MVARIVLAITSTTWSPVADFGGYANTRINDRLLTYMFGAIQLAAHSPDAYVQFLFVGSYVWKRS